MSGYWWIRETRYRRDSVPQWVNKDECIEPSARERYERQYDGTDRSLRGLKAKPLFTLDHHERRPSSIRNLTHGGGAPDWGPFFLMSVEFAAFLRKFDPDCLATKPCDLDYCGRVRTAEYVLADVVLRMSPNELVDRARSQVTLGFGSLIAPGLRHLRMSMQGPVRLKPGIRIERCLFRVTQSFDDRIMVSDQVAEALFRTRLPGIALEDATGTRRASEPFRSYSDEAWDEM